MEAKKNKEEITGKTMNIHQQLRINERLLLVRTSNRPHPKHKLDIRFSLGESLPHLLKKAEICYSLRQQGLTYITEAVFDVANGDGRADILCLDNGIAYEIVCSEKEESLVRKTKKYPEGIKLEVVRV